MVYSTFANAATYTVNTPLDIPGSPGPNTQSLRWAITQANINPGTDVIQFNIASTPIDILLLEALPTITDGLVIDGTSQYAPPLQVCERILLDGSAMSTPGYGLQIRSANCEIYGLHFTNFELGGILVENGASNFKIGGPLLKGNIFTQNKGNHISVTDSPNGFILGNYIGVDCNQTAAQACPGGNNGIYIKNSANVKIGGLNNSDSINIIGAACANGILVENSNFCQIVGNYIGIGVNGNDIGNEGAGIKLSGNSKSCTIGGAVANAGNTIGKNNGAGIDIADNGVDFAYMSLNQFKCNENGGIIINGRGGIGNDNISTPVITRTYICNGIGVAEGTFNGPASTQIQLYLSSENCNECQGEKYVATATVQSGSWFTTFDASFTGKLTALALAPNKSTSTFADCKDIIIIEPGPKAIIKVNGPTAPELYNKQLLTFTNDATPNGICSWVIYQADGQTVLDTLKVDANCSASYLFNKPGNYVVELKVTHPLGCVEVKTLPLNILMSELQVLNNVITPNGDGFNDVLKVTGLFKSYKLLVFDRMGNQIFNTDAVSNYWNGKCNTNNDCPPGSYFYTIDVVSLDDFKFRKTGQVTVIR